MHKLVGEHLDFALVYEEDDFFVLLCIANGIHKKEVYLLYNHHSGRPIIFTNSYRQLYPFKGSVNLLIRQVAFLLGCD